MSKKPLNNEQTEKVKKFLEEKKRNTDIATVKGKNLKNGEPFEYSLEPKKNSD